MRKELSWMEYLIFGEGEKKLVIIPGLSIHSVMRLADQIEEAYGIFARDYTVYLFDRPKKLKEDITIREIAKETAEAMKALDIEDACVLGVSQGGMIAQYLAMDHPALVSRLVLGSTLSRSNAFFEKVVDKWLQLAKDRNEEGLIKESIRDIYSRNTLEQYEEALISANRGITEEEYARFMLQAKACLSFDCYEKLPGILCPVLVLGSRGDQVVTARGSEEIAESLHCGLYLYDDCYGHAVYDEAPDYKQRCREFFEGESHDNA